YGDRHDFPVEKERNLFRCRENSMHGVCLPFHIARARSPFALNHNVAGNWSHVKGKWPGRFAIKEIKKQAILRTELQRPQLSIEVWQTSISCCESQQQNI